MLSKYTSSDLYKAYLCIPSTPNFYRDVIYVITVYPSYNMWGAWEKKTVKSIECK